jgi:hypothetical protein
MSISPDVRAAVRALAAQPAWAMDKTELIATTEDLYRLMTEVNAQALRLLAEIDHRDLAPAAGAPTTAAWLVARLRMNHGPARHQVKLANALTRHPATAAALAKAAFGVEHAQVITTAVDALPASVDAATVAAAEDTLIEQATAFTPRQLVRVGQGLHTALDPDGPRPDDTDTPDPGYFLNLRSRDDGSCEGEFWLDPAAGLQLTALIQAGSAPRPSAAEGADLRTAGRRRHDALADLLRLATAQSAAGPVPGMGRPTLAVTISLADLRAGLPAVGLDQTRIDPAVVRRMACDAGIIPVLLGSRSQVLDIGRRSKTVPAAIRRALILRDKGCAFPGCDRPDSWADAHHVRHWSHGGETALSNLVLLCEHHHTTIHHRGWRVRLDPDGLPKFTPPHWLQPAYHHAA